MSQPAVFSQLWRDVLPSCVPCPKSTVCQSHRVVGCENDEDVFTKGIVSEYPIFHFFGLGSYCIHPGLLSQSNQILAESEKRKAHHHSVQVN